MKLCIYSARLQLNGGENGKDERTDVEDWRLISAETGNNCTSDWAMVDSRLDRLFRAVGKESGHRISSPSMESRSWLS